MGARPATPCNTVLIVEDEPFTRLMAADVLSSAGYAVLEAGTAHEALSILESEAKVGVVFTDVDMPGSLDGLELAKRVGERWPSIGIVISSGHLCHMAKVPCACSFLAKPYSGPVLIRHIRDSAILARPNFAVRHAACL